MGSVGNELVAIATGWANVGCIVLPALALPAMLLFPAGSIS